MELEPYYCYWVSHLTSEGLHDKADIATVLAILHQQRDEMQDDALRLHREKMDALFGPDGKPRSAGTPFVALGDLKEAEETVWACTGSAFLAGEKCDPNDRQAIYLKLCTVGNLIAAAREELSVHSATEPIIDPRDLALIRVLDDLDESGNGWNPATMPESANAAERKFRDMLVTNWKSIRRLIPIRTTDRNNAPRS